MSKETNVEFDSLVGFKMLSGYGTTSVAGGWNGGDTCNVTTFVLDGVAYSAIEDPDDGYRSAMGRFYRHNTIPSYLTMFEPVRVLCVTGVSISCEDTLVLIDAETCLEVLEVGTDCSDDYYPCYINSWNPNNMAINTHVRQSSNDYIASRGRLAEEASPRSVALTNVRGSLFHVSVKNHNELVHVYKILDANSCIRGVTDEIVTQLFISGYI